MAPPARFGITATMTDDQNPQPLRAGVAGAGVFGGYHANKYTEVAGAELVAIFDADPARAEAAATARGVAAFTDFAAFLAAVDVVTIATPASTHASLAATALAAGRHVLVEKPIALNLDDADRLIAQAVAAGLVLQVGHQERYVTDALGLLAREAPARLRSRRLNRFSGRAMDVSVVFDLMIHDLDLLSVLTGDAMPRLVAVEAVRQHGTVADKVAVELAFPGGCTAQLEASRIEDVPLRDLTLDYAAGTVHLDFLTRQTTNGTPLPLAVDLSAAEKPAGLADPLRFGTQVFVDAVHQVRRQDTKRSAGVSGQDARRALALAIMIETAANAAMEN